MAQQQVTNEYLWQPTISQPLWSIPATTTNQVPSSSIADSTIIPLVRKRTWDDDASINPNENKRSRHPLGDITNSYCYPSF